MNQYWLLTMLLLLWVSHAWWDAITGSALLFPALVLILCVKQKNAQQKPSSASLKLFAIPCCPITWTIFKGLFSVHWEEFYSSDWKKSAMCIAIALEVLSCQRLQVALCSAWILPPLGNIPLLSSQGDALDNLVIFSREHGTSFGTTKHTHWYVQFRA